MDAVAAEAEAVGEETAVAGAAKVEKVAKVTEPDVARGSPDGEDVDEGPRSGTP